MVAGMRLVMARHDFHALSMTACVRRPAREGAGQAETVSPAVLIRQSP